MEMWLHGTDYGPIWAGAGALGFFGEGYWFHRFVPSLHGLTFVAKTVTLDGKIGNMQLDRDTWQPQELFPKCVYVDLIRGVALNSVGLSNFGMHAAFHTGKWQKVKGPFMLSFMPVTADKLGETRAYVEYLKPRLRRLDVKLALQVNLSCPNTGEDLEKLTSEATEILKLLQDLGIPLVPKFNIMTSVMAVEHITKEVEIAGVCVSNTIPYGQLKSAIAWEELFGEKSPLEHLGGGGLSGWPLFPLVVEWVAAAKAIGLSVPINAGGGILHARDVHDLFDAGADSVSIASVIMLRPWRVPSIIKAATDARMRKMAAAL